MRPSVSVLSAVHNEARYIGEMLASLSRQTLQDWELVVADDGSTDDTLNILQSAARQDARIRVIASGEKVGKVRAFNKAFDASKGNVIVLLAGDDRLPPDSLENRLESLQDALDKRALATFRLRVVSEESSLDGLVLPRRGSSRSGGVIAMTRPLAVEAFPIDERLVAEDIWLGYAAADRAEKTVASAEVVLEYRIHPGNSNPRALPFSQMSESMHARHRAWKLLSESETLDLSEAARVELRALWKAEEFRYSKSLFRLMACRGVSLGQRLALLSMASPLAYVLRTRFYSLLAGRRGL